jgi:N-acetylated-alpha-linked acidic dipeptidase
VRAKFPIVERELKRVISAVLTFALILPNTVLAQQPTTTSAQTAKPAEGPIFGFRDFTAQRQLEQKFIAVPDPKLAQQHLKTLTAAPHMAGTPEDRKTAEYVAERFREAGLETRVEEYKVWINYPVEMDVRMTAPAGVVMHGPTREHVEGDPFQDDPRVVMPFNGSSPSGDVEAEVVYANYGSPDDLKRLKQLGVDVKGKILLVRYGQNFRGVKSFVAQENGAAGVIIYSDPIDDGYFKGDIYPKGPYRPATGVQRGSVQYMFEYPGDPTTPGIASVPDLPESKRTPPAKAANMPQIPTLPISYQDAQPILANLGGPQSPREWQGALPFTYHVGAGPAKVKMHLKQDYQYRTIWDVIGIVRGAESPNEWVVAGNHRDAWVYGAVDPNSGTAAMLEAVHGLGALLKSGWKPKRTIVFGSWDAEEQGLIGSTEFAERYEKELANAAAYFNMDVAVAGPNFGSSAVPSLKQFVRDVTKSVPSPKGGTVYDAWLAESESAKKTAAAGSPAVVAPSSAISTPATAANPDAATRRTTPVEQQPQTQDVSVGNLGSGSDYTPFLQHLGIPATDIGSGGPYGVYHSVFDNYAWFEKFGDPTFVYEQQMARVFGLQILRMANADVLPYDYEQYGKEIATYIATAEKRAQQTGVKNVNFAVATAAAHRFQAAGKRISDVQHDANADAAKLNAALRGAERALLTEGLPNRTWFKHAVYAPGEYTGYAAVVIPGVNEAIDKNNNTRLDEQLAILAKSLDRAAATLEAIK